MSRYRVEVQGVDVAAPAQGFMSLPEAVTGYSQTIRHYMRREVTVQLTYHPPVEQGMFGITMPPEVIATFKGRPR